NIEKTLREKRYKKLFEIAIKTGCNKIATGHTLDDHIETFFINFFRGSGLSGLCGIWSKSNIFPESEVVIVRPLLCIEKKEILNYLKENKIEYMIDKSNLSLNFFRNRIRNEIIPFLLKYRPSLKKIILRMTEIIKTEEKFLKNYTEQILKEISKREGEKIIIDLEKFMKLEDAIKKRVAGYIYKEIEKTPYVNSNKIEKIVKSIEKGEKILGKKILDRILKNEKEKKKSFVVSINIPGETKILNKFIVESEIIPFSEKIFRNTDKFTGYFDFSKINGIIIVRNRKIGDRFIPLGLKKEKKISRFMIDKKIPQFQRDEILIFENNGKIMWLCGYEISEEFKVDKNTKKVLKIHVKY
ncbi:MAG: tRNA lysidine(34) synthetase TilS, partial [bacterium]|nr:tRNA lysidine(34) synthetase TilS [bacterium]